MTFVNPLLLAGTAAIVVPLVLHLIMRQKPRHFEFPALRFLVERHETNQRRLRWRHLLLLALRAALIALLAFALARPSVKLAGALGSQEAPVAAAMVFDTSMRMDYRQENRSRLERAQSLGTWLLAQLPRESQIAVLDTRRAPAAFSVDRGAAKYRLERLTTTAVSQPLLSTLGDALQLLEKSELARKELYIFTDLSQASWPSVAAASFRERLAGAKDVGVYVIDVGAQEPRDFALGETQPLHQILSTHSPLRVETQVRQVGPASGPRTVELYLLDDQRQPVKKGEKQVTLQPGESERLEFQVNALELGTHQGYLQLVGQDGLTADDRRYFTVEVTPPWQILLVAPTPAAESALYLSRALAPPKYRRTGENRFEPTVIGYDKLAQEPLGAFAAVCLLDPAPLDAGVWQKLANYAAEGHGVAIFLGRHAEPIDTFNQKTAQEVLPGKLVRQVRRVEDEAYLLPRNLQHPILNSFRRLTTPVPWETLPVFYYWQLGELARGVNIVVPYNDGQPAILERPLGKGRVVTMTTSVSDSPHDDPWNLLPVSDNVWPFVALSNEMVAYLVGNADKQLNYYAGQAAMIELEPERPFRSYVLSQPDGAEIRLNVEQRQTNLVLPDLEQLGNYRVQAGGNGGIDRGFSLNLPPEQTDLERLSDEQLAAVFKDYPYRVAREESQIERQFTAGRVGRELYPLAIALVALVLSLEHIVANRFYKE